MKIIKRGQPPEERVYRDTCKHCKTEVEFTAREAQFRSSQRDGDDYVWECPICKTENWKNANNFLRHAEY